MGHLLVLLLSALPCILLTTTKKTKAFDNNKANIITCDDPFIDSIHCKFFQKKKRFIFSARILSEIFVEKRTQTEWSRRTKNLFYLLLFSIASIEKRQSPWKLVKGPRMTKDERNEFSCELCFFYRIFLIFVQIVKQKKYFRFFLFHGDQAIF